MILTEKWSIFVILPWGDILCCDIIIPCNIKIVKIFFIYWFDWDVKYCSRPTSSPQCTATLICSETSANVLKSTRPKFSFQLVYLVWMSIMLLPMSAYNLWYNIWVPWFISGEIDERRHQSLLWHWHTFHSLLHVYCWYVPKLTML